MTLTNKNILLIGGTGSFGTAFLNYILAHHPEVNRVVIFSRDEQKQYELANSLSTDQKKKVQFVIGDVRDKERLMEILPGIHIVIHAAAMKHVPITEANPGECYKTNVVGTKNLVEATMVHSTERVVALSTDKAVMPINVYGNSKQELEKLIVDAQSGEQNKKTIYSVVRYANVLGSRGSVVPFFQRIKEAGELPITDFRMTRFSITMQQGIEMVLHALENSVGGEIFVPKAPSYKIATVAEAIAPKSKLKEVGIRNGEKISELMVSRLEASRTLEKKSCYVVLPENEPGEKYYSLHGDKRVPVNFEYDSATNSEWLSVAQLKEQIGNL
ncbi:MAG: polysaccharide biosynthesis protein [Cyclobacteriaceae bacterium]